MTTKKWFILMCIAAGLSVVSFFQINSWWADQHKFNGVFGWLGIGIVLGLVAVFCLYKVNQTGGTPNAQ